jgi:hypothetical protein
MHLVLAMEIEPSPAIFASQRVASLGITCQTSMSPVGRIWP